MAKTHWTDERVSDLDRLGRLLDALTSLNASSGALDLLNRAVEDAHALQRDTLAYPSFVRFLKGEAIREREARHGTSESPTPGA